MAVMRMNGAADFEDLLRLIGQFGAYRPPSKMDYGTAIVVNRMGGWKAVCEWRDKDLKERKRSFIAIHRQVHNLLQSDAVETLHGVRLGGIHETTIIYPDENSRTYKPELEEWEEKAMDARTEVFWEKPKKGPYVPFG